MKTVFSLRRQRKENKLTSIPPKIPTIYLLLDNSMKPNVRKEKVLLETIPRKGVKEEIREVE